MANTILDRYEALAAAAKAETDSVDSASTIIIQVGSATCENAAGSMDVWQEFERNIRTSGRKDIQLHRVGCTGRCSREPIVGILMPGKMPVKYQQVDRDTAHEIFTQHILGGTVLLKSALEKKAAQVERQIILCEARHCNGTCCDEIETLFRKAFEKESLDADAITITHASGLGFCSARHESGATCAMVRPDNVVYFIKSKADVERIVKEHFAGGKVVESLRCEEELLSLHFFDLYGDIAFFNQQNRIALRNAGIIDPESLQESLRYHGFRGLALALSKGDPGWVVDQVTQSKLRGRGGGGYPTGLKWAAARKS
ncbi:MAG TPA: NADH-quinone oxidoreductase subunit E, partial [Candidatus Hydrogenedentes bacterium]|nr:NADH-quinone oxidoreductase subunit E [Candidatus Hydrogenedentota bacterium]